jgi:hypothetical protein
MLFLRLYFDNFVSKIVYYSITDIVIGVHPNLVSEKNGLSIFLDYCHPKILLSAIFFFSRILFRQNLLHNKKYVISCGTPQRREFV